jgi:hypothetical protein
MEPRGVVVEHSFAEDFDGGESLADEIIFEGQWLFTLREGNLYCAKADSGSGRTQRKILASRVICPIKYPTD